MKYSILEDHAAQPGHGLAGDLDPMSQGETAAIVASGVTFRYGTTEVLRGLSFRVERGELFAFLGPNGSGKTTLFRLLSTLTRPQEGALTLLGCQLPGEIDRVRPKLGVVFQSPSLDRKLTVAENLDHHGRLYGLYGAPLHERIKTLLEVFALTEYADSISESLSGGFQRRAELAKALLHQPQLLILDEPSTGLDPRARREFLNYLLRLRDRDRVTIVFTTHYTEEAERADRVAVLDRGTLVAIERPARLRSLVGGDVIEVRSSEPAEILQRLRQQFHLEAAMIDGTIRIKAHNAARVAADIVESCGEGIESVRFGKPTLEDAFVQLTGHSFDAAGEKQQR